MPADPNNVSRRETISEDYHDEPVTVDFYTNSAIAIYRGDEDMPEGRVWLDNLEKQELHRVLGEELDGFDNDLPPPERVADKLAELSDHHGDALRSDDHGWLQAADHYLREFGDA